MNESKLRVDGMLEEVHPSLFQENTAISIILMKMSTNILDNVACLF